ncbi:23S rRNA pseudouridine(1911/1915/1917) synthase RluD [Nitrosococcus watsonii]|uniref:Pseudouridine synthase n=1 Tax=Nitrosococcus watsoni (strain C-113) TaxID=105559 RepID=D8KB00_NITWC|nr:23S rRNA pseudouridine(1911/1915/1917) synthase RluD [Nitrosococcus watsonii]ADJ27534.1 pseudouridine synthase, RluA family [Nitrosococcus watsonii C-113]
MRETIELSITLPSELAGKRLDQALAQVFPAYSRSRLQQWIKHGQVKVNDALARPRDTVQGGEWIVVIAEAEAETGWKSQPLPLEIIYEDEAIIVVNKPAGLVVHPAAGNRDGTLVNALLHHAPELERIPRAGIVHRLDKDTSGLLVVARNLVAHHGLIQQLQARRITREYQAITVGVMTSGGRIEAPIQRHPVNRKRMAVISTGKPALTHYRVVSRFRIHTHILCRLETGRTHQIRVHLAHIGYPLLGDPTYGKRLHIPRESSEELSTALRHFKRQALHAARLGLVHPEKKQAMNWEAPLPEDMATMLALLEQDRQHHI